MSAEEGRDWDERGKFLIYVTTNSDVVAAQEEGPGPNLSNSHEFFSPQSKRGGVSWYSMVLSSLGAMTEKAFEDITDLHLGAPACLNLKVGRGAVPSICEYSATQVSMKKKTFQLQEKNIEGSRSLFCFRSVLSCAPLIVSFAQFLICVASPL